jgi:class 3 adenylate cyclase
MSDTSQVLQDTRAENLLHTYIKNIADDKVFHIDVYKLADDNGIPRRDILGACIRSVAEGTLVLEWVYHCPHCGGVPKETVSLHEASHEDYCPVCKVNFTNVIDSNIEVFFSLHPAKAPQSSTLKERYHSLMRKEITEHMKFDWRTPATILAVDVLQHPLYRELFGSETLPQDQSLELMKSTILFTDIKGSTRMYTALGDAKAFSLVREHFRILFEYIEKYNGLPVKTIGDAVMGSFVDDRHAIQAAIEAQQALKRYYQSRPEHERIEVKIGIHSGPTILVTLNNRLDYFGTTVNMAARIQSVAQPNEILVSEKVFEPQANRVLIGRYVSRVYRSSHSFKGLDGTYQIYHIRL